MTQEEKQLLLQDLCSRLPYQPKLQIYYEEMSGSGVFDEELWEIDGDGQYCNGGRRLEDIKPYLRPMSSMIEEEFQELHSICPHSAFNKTNVPGWIIGIDGSEYGRISRINEISKLLDWLNSHHFDYRGLIEKGLALEVPEGIYKKWTSLRGNLKEDNQGNIVGGLKL